VVLAYHRLHELGHAHSIEVWEEDELVGGMYGVSQGRLFCGESMFSRRVNASKTALMVFSHAFARDGGQLIDCQVLNSHTASLGAVEIPRREYLEWLRELRLQKLLPISGCPGNCFYPPDECFRHIFYQGVIMDAQSSFCLLPRHHSGKLVSGTSFISFFVPLYVAHIACRECGVRVMRKSRFAAFYRTNLYLTDELRHYLAGSKIW
jgi:hypothetical protein